MVNKAEFSRLAGVTRAAVTKAVAGKLAPAVDGKLIDANHPAAREYIEHIARDRAEPPATGLDPLYEQAVAECQRENRYSNAFLKRQLKVSYNRAAKIMSQIKAAGLIPEKGAKETPAPERNVPASGTAPAPKVDGRSTSKHVRGSALKKQQMKSGPPVLPVPTPADDDDTEYDPLEGIPDDIRKLADWSLRDLVNRFGSDVRFGDWLKALKSIEEVHDKRLRNAEREGELVHRNVVKAGIIDTINTYHRRLLTDGAKTIGTRAHALVESGASAQELEELAADQIGSFIRPCKSKMERVMRNI